MGISLNPTDPTASGVTHHIPEPSLGFRCWVGHRDAVGSLPSWAAAHPSDPSGEEQGTTLGSKLRERR